MNRLRFRILATTAAVALLGVVAAFRPSAAETPKAQHVLLISVDGLHQTDLAWYVSHRPGSELAKLVNGGVNFTNAVTPFPSDSFPGIVGQVTGGNPQTTGIYYDDSYNHALLPAGTTSCAGVAPGVEVTYFEAAAKDPHALDSGQGLAGLPDSILSLTSNATSLINPAALPVDPNTCQPVYPHQYIKVNTVFEVARAHGLRTAWSDKHAAYEVLNGPSGVGVQDFFTPEINSNASFSGALDWTGDNALTQIYDGYKVQAVINEINGFDHSGKHWIGTPAIFGMNFQTISTAQKLPGGGYQADGVTPSAMLENALNYINNQIAAFQAALKERDLQNKTVIILSAKHGQSPTKPTDLTRIDDGALIDQLNADWKAADPVHHTADLVAFAIDDDGMLMWLNDTSQPAADFAKAHLMLYAGTGNGVTGAPKAFTNSGLATIYAGNQVTAVGFVPGDPRTPDVVGIAKVGTVYTGKKAKIAEHGGNNFQDRHVALVISGGEIDRGKMKGASVETTQIAPTILALLGLNPQSLQAVQIEHTQSLPLG